MELSGTSSEVQIQVKSVRQNLYWISLNKMV